MASWFVSRLGLNLPLSERNALSIFLAFGIKSVLMFFYLVLVSLKFIIFPSLLTLVIYLLYLYHKDLFF